jgi:hypothetical protein
MGFVLSRLWHFADTMPILMRRKLVNSLIVSLFLYYDVVHSHLIHKLGDLSQGLSCHWFIFYFCGSLTVIGWAELDAQCCI